jgi:tRNA threonylcarbamoyl adenosine modification protein YeaZ
MSGSIAIVVCGPQLEVAFRAPEQETASLVRLGGISPRSTLILAAADLLVEDAGIEPSAVDRVLVTRGPGSFTGIRAGIATAQGLAAASGAEIVAYDSLLVQAARCDGEIEVWAAQPGRRGEVYGRAFESRFDAVPDPFGDIEVLAVESLAGDRRWIAPEALDLGSARRAAPVMSAAEALFRLDALGARPQPVEPLYVEGPPIQAAARK